MTNSKLLSAAMGGAALGAILGVLLAPKSGAETRSQILKATQRSAQSLDELIEEGKRTWYETKGKGKMGIGIAADELDDFMRHMLNKGEKAWSKAKNKAGEVADDAEGAIDSAMNHGRKAANNIREAVS